jgi:ABC-type Fe3+ transport system substrate-binding protein
MLAVSAGRLAILVAACQVLFLHNAGAADQALIDAAKKEGTVTWYTTLIVNQMTRPAVDAFQKKYGITVNYFRADTNAMILRLQNEAQAGKTQADVIDTTSGTPVLKRMGLLEQWLPESAKSLPADYVDPEGYWVAASLYILTLGYNTDLVRKGAEPKSLTDLLDLKWKGKIAVSGNASSPGVGGFVGLVLATMGEPGGIDYLKALARQQPAVIQASTRQVLDMVIAGEYSVGLQILNHHVAFSANRGAPVGWVKLDPAMAAFLALGVVKGPHRNAGKLLVDFLMSDEGQALFRGADYIPVAPNVPPQDPALRPDGKTFRALYFTPEKLDENMKRWMTIYADTLQ